MGDVIFVATVVAFFALAAAYVGACARIVAGDEVVDEPIDPATATATVTATAQGDAADSPAAVR